VDPVDRREPLAREEARDGLVRRQHRVFDRPVGIVALEAADVLHATLLIELDHRLGQLEVERAALLALPAQARGDRAERFDLRGDRGGERRAERTALGPPFEHRGRIFVSQLPATADHGFVEARLSRPSAAIDDELHHHRQAIDVGPQRTEVG